MATVLDHAEKAEGREEVSGLIARQFYSRATDRLPLYRRLHETIEELIREGKLQPGTQMPPEQHLASSLGISLGTVQKGLQSLSSKRLIVREHGRGTFVSPARHSLTELRLFRFLDRASETLLPVYATILERQLVQPDPELMSIFGHDPEGYVRLTRLVDVDGLLSCLSEIYLPASLFGRVMQMPKSDFDDVNLNRLFAERLNIVSDIYSQKIKLIKPNDEIKTLLKLPPQGTVVEMEIIERSPNNVVTARQKIYIPPSPYALDIRGAQHT
jgi:GntR family transcriptional regulator